MTDEAARNVPSHDAPRRYGRVEALFKIATLGDWATTQREGTFPPSADDRRDGYIHLCTAAQLARTAAKWFAGRDDLVLLEVSAPHLDDATLRWERSGSGGLFPHVHGPLRAAAIARVHRFPLGGDGLHVVPPDLARG